MTAQALPADAARRGLAPQPGLAVVKLGGSVVRSRELSAWLDVIAASPRPIVVVPGGGALADEVRSAQTKLGFGDGAAHRMALLAMDQLAWAIAGLTLPASRSAIPRRPCGEPLARDALRYGRLTASSPIAATFPNPGP